MAGALARSGRYLSQPLRMAFAAVLREYFAGKHPRVAAFRMPSAGHVAQMLRADEAFARGEWIEATTGKERQRREESTFLVYRDDAGKVLDFHSLRHTYITRLCRAGIHPKIAQRLARHSTIQLTLDHYSHVEDEDLAPAIETVPEIGSGGHALDKTRRQA